MTEQRERTERRSGDAGGGEGTAGGAPAGSERRKAPVRGRRAWTGREAIIWRLRQPVIGLTLAGAAIPIVAANQRQAAESGTDDAEAADPTLEPMATTDAEEDLAERIGETEAGREREAQVAEAEERYSIDRELAEKIYDIALEQNIEPKLAYGLVKTESTFRQRAVSPVGARGLTQVMPRTAAWMVPGTTPSDLFDPETNLRLGFQYLSQMIDKYRGNVKLALLAYNRGPGTVDRVLKQGGNPDNGYADKVIRG